MKMHQLTTNVVSKRDLAVGKTNKQKISFKAADSNLNLPEAKTDTFELNEKKQEDKKTLSKGAIAAIAIGTSVGIAAISVPVASALLRKNKWKDVDIKDSKINGLKKGMCKLGDSINEGLSKLKGKEKSAVKNEEKVSQAAKEVVNKGNEILQPINNTVNLNALSKNDIKDVSNSIKNIESKTQKNHENLVNLVSNLPKTIVSKNKYLKYQNFVADMVTCKTEKVGQKFDLKEFLFASHKYIEQDGDVVSLNHILNPEEKKSIKIEVSRDNGNTYTSMSLIKSERQNKIGGFNIGRKEEELQNIEFKNAWNNDVGVMETKNKLMAVLEDKNSVIIGNQGEIKQKNTNFEMKVHTPGIDTTSDVKPLEHQEYVKPNPMPSIGVGGQVVIGLQDGRFCESIIDSLQHFESLINNEKLVLPQFVAAKGVENMQIEILSGGFGSRAEYTNAASNGIYHHDKKPNDTDITKGSYRMITGLTPIETNLITLHEAGIIDCSKGVFGIGKNLKFYKNDSKVNKGNGGFTLKMYEKMKQDNVDSIFVMPNDSVSRMTKATKDAAKIMNEGNAAIVMIASQVPWKKARGNFGIMKLTGENNEIKQFAEKPKNRIDGFIDEKENCYTNTFQFMVHKDALKAINILEPHFKTKQDEKESRDWSKQLLPALMAISQYETPAEMKTHFLELTGQMGSKDAINIIEDIDDNTLLEAKKALNGKKIVAVKSDEPWIDAGQFDNMYDVSMKIASGEFKLSDLERSNALKCVNFKTGLIASTPQLKEQIEQKYDIKGRFMAIDKVKNLSTKNTVDVCLNNGSLIVDKDD